MIDTKDIAERLDWFAKDSRACSDARMYSEAAAEIRALRAANAELVESLRECSDGLAEAVDAAWPHQWRKSPDNARKYERDMEPVVRARSAPARNELKP